MSRNAPTALNRIVAACGGRIVAGPFQGMRYLDRAIGSALPPKYLGTYEREVHAWIEEIARTPYRDIHVVGAAEGYYAVGLALRVSGARVYAYDMHPASTPLVRRLAARNGVGDRVRCAGIFPPVDVSAATGGKTLIVCDIEGAEAELLDPSTIPVLRRVDMLVEVHDAGRGEIEHLLRQRFATSHEIRRVTAVRRTLADVTVSVPLGLRPRAIVREIDEGRKRGLTWLFLVAAPVSQGEARNSPGQGRGPIPATRIATLLRREL